MTLKPKDNIFWVSELLEWREEFWESATWIW